MRIAIGGILHESNSFSEALTDIKAFESGSITFGEEVLCEWTDSHHEVGGFIEGAERFGYDLIPALVAQAVPSGPVTGEAFDTLVGELIARIRNAGEVDGLLLALHGAMVCEKHPDADGEIVTLLRQEFGPAFPIVVTHDFHANISERIISDSTALVVYKTNPHVDQRQLGLQAADIIRRSIHGEVKPAQTIAKPPMLLNIRYHNTSHPPLAPIMQAAIDLERNNPKVLAASVAGAYQYADVAEMGPGVVVVTDNDPALARRESDRLSNMLWDMREQLVIDLPDAEQAVRLAMREESPPPVILVDMGDNVGGGSAADGTVLITHLLQQQAEGWLVVLYDPLAVQECIHVGVRQPIKACVGGKTDNLHGNPVTIEGRVRSVHDGLYEETQPRHGGKRHNDQGITAVIEIPAATTYASNLVVLTSKREPPFSLQQIVSLGIDPARRKIIVVKAAVAFRAAYEPIAGKIIEVDTPGLTCVNPKRFTYKHVRRPLWGLGGDG